MIFIWRDVVGMSKRLRIALLSIIFGLIILGSIICTTVDAQIDDFPIGLELTYNDKWTSGGIGMPYTSEESIEFEFVRWVDDSQSIVEITKDGISTQTRFPIGSIDVGSGVPLWVDTSQWSNGLEVTFQGQRYNVTATRRSVEGGVFDCWELTYHIFQSSSVHYYYERSFGFLIIYISTSYSSYSFNQQVYELSEGNLDEFIAAQFPLFQIILGIGIIIELCIILYVFNRRYR